MTEEQKDILTARMLDAPATLTDAEIEAILADAELRDIYDMSVAVGNACNPGPEADLKEEWDRFSRLLHRRPSRTGWLPRVAAIFFGVILLSGIVKTVIDRALTADSPPLIAEVAATAPSDTVDVPEPTDPDVKDSDEEPQASATRRQAQNEPSATAEAPDLDEYIRIDQARIDNELALLTAAEIEAESEDMLIMMLEEGEEIPDGIDTGLTQLTLQ